MKFNSIRFKISVLYTVVLGVILIIYSGVLYVSLQHILYSDIDGELRIKAQKISSTISSYLKVVGSDEQSFIFARERAIRLRGTHPSINKIKELERQWLKQADKLDLENDYINFLDSQGKLITSSVNLQKENTFSYFLNGTKIAKIEEGFKSIKFGERNLRVINLPFNYKGKKGYIQVATSLKPTIYILQNRLRAITISIPAILLLAIFVGRLFAIRILRPVEEITKTAKRITHEDLSSRVETEHTDEEMRLLTSAFNEMISRLEKSFKYIAEFSSHVAHELKTPLAIIRGESEIALRKIRDPEEYQRVIRISLEEVARMLRTVEDLLLLAKLDYRPELFKFEQFDLVPFLREIYEQSKILASQKNITVNIDMPQRPVNINADKLHLRRMFFNLIHNAIKFNSINGKIDIAVRSEDKSASISISDTGIGIAAKDLPKIFNKFFHIDRAGQNIEPGNGLGLSIAQSIAKIHRGNIEAESQFDKGSTFTVTLSIS